MEKIFEDFMYFRELSRVMGEKFFNFFIDVLALKNFEND